MCILTLEKVDSGPEQHTNVYQIGEHVIGRGPELQCTSKKVSRKHALLKVTQNDGVFLESTHNNPCYHQSKNTQSIQIVSFSKSIKLNNEDKIALALDHGWFKAKISKSNEELPADSIKNKRELVDNNEGSEAKKIKLNDVQTEISNEDITDLQIDEVNNDVPDVRNDTVETEGTAINGPVEPEVTAKNGPVEPEVAAINDPGTDVPQNEPDVSNTVIKQEPLDESVNEPELPEVKQEPADISTEIKDEPEDDPKNTGKQDNSTTNSNDPTSASTSLGNGSRRDRCWYGSSCYRKNPTHRATFSHPNDADYDSDPNDTRAICCYGANCYRRNKLHRQKYRHPNQDKIPKPPSKQKSKEENHFHIHFRSHQQPSPNLFVRRIRIPCSNNHRYIVIDFDAFHPFDNLILDEDLDLFDDPSDHSDSDYFSEPDA